jgi:hypothetical protein
MAKQILHNEESTPFPDAPISKPIPKLSDDQWGSLGETIMQLVEINRGNREALNRSTNRNIAMYEMRLKERSAPYRNPSNLCTPVVAAAVDELTSRIVGTVIQPRTITVRGNNPQAAQNAHLVEQFLNNEADERGWWECAENCIQLSARDGTSFAWLNWDLSTHEQVYFVEQPQMDENGQQVVDENGEPVMQRVRQSTTFVDFDAPRWTEVALQDFLMVPNYARSIDKADMALVKTWPNEHDLDALVNAKILDANQVERALQYVNTAQGELSRDPDGYYEYTIGGRLDVVDVSVSAPSGIRMSRGPLEVWVGITNLFDLDGDGHFEENIVWIHQHSRLLLGFAPYEYHRGRNIIPLSIWPRPDLLYGFAVGDRLGSSQDEKNALRNGRLDYVDKVVNPLPYKTDNATIEEDQQKTGFNTYIKVQNPTDYGYIQPPPLQQDVAQEEQIINSDIAQIMASAQTPSLPSSSGGQRMSRRQQQAQDQARSLANARTMMKARKFLLKCVKFSVGLYLQYGKSQMQVTQNVDGAPQQTPFPRELLAQDYTFGINGLGGVMDKEGRREDMLMLYDMGMKNPLIANDPKKVYMLTRQVWETFDIPEVTAILGTMEDAVQQAQVAQKAAQDKQIQDMALQVISHGAIKPNPPGQQKAHAQ